MNIALPIRGMEADAQELPPLPSRNIGGIAVADLGQAEAVALLQARLAARAFTRIGFLNAHCFNVSREDEDYRRCLEDFLVLPDGVGVDLAAKILFGRPFSANLNGTDFLPAFLRLTQDPLKVALIGSRPGVCERASEAFRALAPQHDYVAVSHGFFSGEIATGQVLQTLRAAQADILLVGLGVPRQELFIARHVGPQEAILAFAVGALMDFMAGEVPRAPKAVRRLRLEWAYRLALEPRRMARRYIIGNPKFLAHVMREKRTTRRAAAL